MSGSRDDLVVDASRCLRMRFSESGCRHCSDSCPHGAVSLESGLVIDPEVCRGCMLCTSVCPVGALEQNGDFNACLAKLSKVHEPVLGCVRTKEHCNAALACLGGLSVEHLLVLNHTLAGTLTLNLSLCSDCPNSAMISALRPRLDALPATQSDYANCCIQIAESVQEIHYCDEPVDRRGFFKSFRTALFSCAAVILSPNNEQSERCTEYAGKRIPIRRKLLNSTRNRLSHEMENQIRKHFDSCVSFDETCTRCQGCVAICPTGALNTDKAEEKPTFEPLLCTGCGLCREFCLEDAVRIRSGISDVVTP